MTAIIGDLTPYDLGDRVTCTAVFTDGDGDPIDPTVVKFSFRTPAGVVTTYTYGTDAQLVKIDVGEYSVQIDVDTSGEYFYRFFSTGTGKAAQENAFEVREARAV